MSPRPVCTLPIRALATRARKPRHANVEARGRRVDLEALDRDVVHLDAAELSACPLEASAECQARGRVVLQPDAKGEATAGDFQVGVSPSISASSCESTRPVNAASIEGTQRRVGLVKA